MKFHLVDRIESISPGKRIVTTKALSLAEEYLADHFPAFPVMPGVLMVEALVQSGAWLVRIAQDFAKSIVVLGSARNVKYASFVQPGQVLRCEVEAMEIGESSAKLKGAGFVGDRQTVSGRLELRCFNLAETRAGMGPVDADILRTLKASFRLVHGPEALEAAGE
ncbi:MAG TPA: 3-hydroxyacyl-ACP dehydratase FabZ family protein [Phycisphaerae bacterium]|nr:3-hydroxyacyl-ACP dehydratase FabZ family protein [Phycisphaerae bacterium]